MVKHTCFQTQKDDIIRQYAETIAEQNNNCLCAASVEIQHQWWRLDFTNYECFVVHLTVVHLTAYVSQSWGICQIH